MTPTPEQQTVLDGIAHWFNNQPAKQQLRFGGLAGTGKTTILTSIPELLNLAHDSIVFCTPTNKACEVLSRKLGFQAQTIHSLLYSPKPVHGKQCPVWDGDPCHQITDSKACDCCYHQFTEREDGKPLPRLIVVDEASMIAGDQYNDIMSLGVRTLFVGDHGQLPPVKSSLNLMDQLDFKLDTPMRQVQDSPIFQLAMHVRNGGALQPANLGPVSIIDERDFRKASLYDILDEQIVITHSNARRVGFNQGYRKHHGKDPNHPEPMDKVICLRGDRKRRGVYNGIRGDVLLADRDLRLDFTMSIKKDDHTIYRGTAHAKQFNNRDLLSMVPYKTDLWDYAYATTCHKAQGTEADEVIVFVEPFVRTDRRWLYTAVTRAKQNLTLVLC